MQIRFVSYASNGVEQAGYCLNPADLMPGADTEIISLDAFFASQGLPASTSLTDAIAAFPDLAERLLAAGADPAGTRVRASDVHLLAPIPRPKKNVFCVGRNYKAHVKEASEARAKEAKIPEHPQYFSKPPTTVVGPVDDVPLHEGLTEALDYEVELGIIIGKRGVNIPREQVFDHIFGYTVINDVTARDLQKRHDRWFKGKGLDGSCPMGPWIVPAGDIPDPDALEVRLSVNGEIRQNASVGEMIFDIRELVSVLSQGITLEPGDIIATGTPSGVGFAMKPPRLLADGDVMELEIPNVGRIRNTVRAGM
ncbi:hydrolase [Seohaeicola zhoushanensis]|uniref:Hydrolase n=2 Tax=Seohaeicola zhoushanensis TaxID=1569283 RepID=A0A8J3M6Y7_9RHOB|nr:hydrolase [Seohaeicola zhoushanensis]